MAGKRTYLVLEGVVSELKIFEVNINYLANAKKNAETAAVVSLLQALTGSPGAIHSAQAAYDQGDTVEGFTMSVGSTKVTGSFWKTTFKNGDKVKLIGNIQNDVFIADAVARPDENVLWMHPHCNRGTIAQTKYILKYSLLFTVIVYGFIAFILRGRNVPLWFLVFTPMFVALVILIVTVGFSWKDFMIFAKKTNDVAIALGIDSPKAVDFSKITGKKVKLGLPELPMGVYYY